ncbi:hypothetical protein [Streptomyces rhizosphaericus]|uniref:hypothetical protein n=1 Tax=Streptomyces rhizosphaericus TaxID=114699 RepID=UPI00117DA1D0|nr:hypothetical protein [Streptomyces rhizosphaericus]
MYRLISAHDAAQNPPVFTTGDRLQVVIEWFARDRPEHPLKTQMQMRTDIGEEWVDYSIPALSYHIRNEDYTGADRADVEERLAWVQSEWLLVREHAAIVSGLNRSGAMIQAYREWALIVQDVVPHAVEVKADSDSQRLGDVPVHLAHARAAALRDVLTAHVEGQWFGSIPRFNQVVAGIHEQHWMSLAACGDKGDAPSDAAWHLSRAVRAHPEWGGILRRRTNEGFDPVRVELALGVALTLRKAGRIAQCAQLLRDLDASPRRILIAISSPGALKAAQELHRRLSTAVARHTYHQSSSDSTAMPQGLVSEIDSGITQLENMGLIATEQALAQALQARVAKLEAERRGGVGRMGPPSASPGSPPHPAENVQWLRPPSEGQNRHPGT